MGALAGAWLLVIFAPYGAVPIGQFNTELQCRQAMMRISYEVAPAPTPTMVCTPNENGKR